MARGNHLLLIDASYATMRISLLQFPSSVFSRARETTGRRNACAECDPSPPNRPLLV